MCGYPPAHTEIPLQKDSDRADERPVTDEAVIQLIREIIAGHARLPGDVASLPTGASLYEAGMTSHASVSVMLALEDQFDIEFPDRMLTRSVFESIDAIAAALSELTVETSI
jgi:acyl carrier protein